MNARAARHGLGFRWCDVFAVVAVALAALAGAAEAQSPNLQHGVRPIVGWPSYFPLQPGNRWVYQTRGELGGGGMWQVEVLEVPAPVQSVPERSLYLPLLGYFDRATRLVRADFASSVFEQGSDGRDHLWYQLRAPVGTSWRLTTAPPELPCLAGTTLTIGARDEVVTVPAGEFRDVVRVDHSGGLCADTGITGEWFAPGVGLVRRVETTIAGPLVSELIYAELGDATWPRRAWATSLELSSPRYVNNLMPSIGPRSLPQVSGTFVLRNRSDVPVELVFGGCRSVTLVVRDEAGTVVLETRADDGGCCACDNLVNVTLLRDTLVLPFSFTLADRSGGPLPDGFYSLTATLDTLVGETLRPAVRARFEVQSVY